MTTAATITTSHAPPETHSASAGGADSTYRVLRVWAEMLDDVMRARVAASNRATRADVDPTMYQPQLDALRHAEHEVALGMRRAYRRVVDPAIREWQKDTIGIGEHLLARLLGAIGHPVWTERHTWHGTGADRELVNLGVMARRVSDLWSYCGVGDAGRKKAKGMTAADAALLGNPRAKMLTRLLAEACMKQHASPYRSVYDDGRDRYAARPDWTPLHQHNAALRLTGKAILRDLWLAGGGV